MEYGNYPEITKGPRMIYLGLKKKNKKLVVFPKLLYVFPLPQKATLLSYSVFFWRPHFVLKQKAYNDLVDNQAVVAAVCAIINGNAHTFTDLLPVFILPENCT